MPRLPDSLRSRLLARAGEEVRKGATRPLLFVEIGAMFGLSEGASTFLLAQAAARGPEGSRVISIEASPEHIDLARRLIGELDRSLRRLGGSLLHGATSKSSPAATNG